MGPWMTVMAAAEGAFHAPTIDDFLPPPIIGPFNRINLIQIFVCLVLVVIFMLYAKRATLVPGRAQVAMETLFDFVHHNICEDAMGKTLGRKYAPAITAIFFTVFGMNITGVIPGMNIAGSSRIAVPLVLAIFAYCTFIYAGIKERGFGTYFAEQLFPAGAPKLLYILLTPIEFVSTFIMRPATLVIRLLANMVAGHMLLALSLIGTETLLIHATGGLRVAGVVTLAASFAVTLFEIFIAALQAYVFSILSAVYINLSVHAH